MLNAGTALAKNALDSIAGGLVALAALAFLGPGGVVGWAVPVGVAALSFLVQNWRDRSLYGKPTGKEMQERREAGVPPR